MIKVFRSGYWWPALFFGDRSRSVSHRYYGISSGPYFIGLVRT